MTPAEQAAANAIQCEMVLYTFRKNNTGTVVGFVIHPDDMPAELATARIGSRYVAVLVQVGDDELPVQQPAKESKADSTPARPSLAKDKPSEKAKRPWRDTPYPQQAGIRIGEPTFAAYLREEHSDEWHETGDADACLKLLCGIDSKRELGISGKPATMWFQLESAYSAWLAKERVGA